MKKLTHILSLGLLLCVSVQAKPKTATRQPAATSRFSKCLTIHGGGLNIPPTQYRDLLDSKGVPGAEKTFPFSPPVDVSMNQGFVPAHLECPLMVGTNYGDGTGEVLSLYYASTKENICAYHSALNPAVICTK